MKGSRVGFNGGGGGAPPPPTDLLVCFPSRAHLTLMPKPICSPSRPTHNSDSTSSKRSRARPLFRTQTANKPPNNNNNRNIKIQLSSDTGSEPTSPKVTCAGQIKVRHKNRDMTSTPRSHDTKNWVDALGLKKDAMNFLGVLRSLKFNMQCFGSFHGAVDCCSDEDEEEEEDDNEQEQEQEAGGGSRTTNVFSKWFMLLEQNEEAAACEDICQKEEEEVVESVPPKNALLLMRCRSAPEKGWLEAGEVGKKVVVEEAEEEEEDEERLMLMSYAPDFFKLSTDIAKETWVVGSADPLARCRSWKR